MIAVVPRGYASELFQFVEVSFDEVALFVDPCAEWEAAGSVLLWRDIGPRAFVCREGSDGIAVVGTVGEKDCVGLERFQHGGGRLSVMRLPGRQNEVDRTAFGIDKRMDFRCEPATGTSHATIVRAPLFAVAAC